MRKELGQILGQSQQALHSWNIGRVRHVNDSLHLSGVDTQPIRRCNVSDESNLLLSQFELVDVQFDPSLLTSLQKLVESFVMVNIRFVDRVAVAYDNEIIGHDLDTL